jgi:hypothetical protein
MKFIVALISEVALTEWLSCIKKKKNIKDKICGKYVYKLICQGKIMELIKI